MKRAEGTNQETDYQFIEKSVFDKRIDLNDLLKRNEEERKKDSKTNLLIVSGVAVLGFVVVLILSF